MSYHKNRGSLPLLTQFNKTKYFRLRLTDEVRSERPKRDLRLTWDWPETDLRLTWDWPETYMREKDEDWELWTNFHWIDRQTNKHLHFLRTWRSQKWTIEESNLKEQGEDKSKEWGNDWFSRSPRKVTTFKFCFLTLIWLFYLLYTASPNKPFSYFSHSLWVQASLSN